MRRANSFKLWIAYTAFALALVFGWILFSYETIPEIIERIFPIFLAGFASLTLFTNLSNAGYYYPYEWIQLAICLAIGPALYVISKFSQNSYIIMIVTILIWLICAFSVATKIISIRKRLGR